MNQRNAVLIGLACAAWVHVSYAQNPQPPADKAMAEALFDSGKQLMEQGKYAEACPKLAESQRLDPAVGTLLYLAECYENNGQTATAWTTFRSAESAAHNAKQTDREQMAHDRAAVLEKSVSRLTIVVPASVAAAGPEVRRDGVIVGSAAWGTAIPLDPGSHVIAVSAPHKQPWSQAITVLPNGMSQTVMVGELQAEVPARPLSSPATAQPVGTEAAQRTAEWTPPANEPKNTQRWVGLATGGVGVVALGIGTAFALKSKSDDDKAAKRCPQDLCDAQGMSNNDDALAAKKAATVSFVIGGVAVVAGLVVFLTAPSASPRPVASIAIAPQIGSGSGGLAAVGRW
jgi:hypothetical protein